VRLADRPHSVLPCRSTPRRTLQPALPVLPPRQQRLRAQRLHHNHSRVNDHAQLTATGRHCSCDGRGSPPGARAESPAPTDPTDPRALHRRLHRHLRLFVINNESGWYEGWMIHDVTVPRSTPLRDLTGRPALARSCPAIGSPQDMGTGNNVPGNTFTVDGKKTRLPAPPIAFRTRPTWCRSTSAWSVNALQQSDAHAILGVQLSRDELGPPTLRVAVHGRVPGQVRARRPTHSKRVRSGSCQSIVPGSGRAE